MSAAALSAAGAHASTFEVDHSASATVDPAENFDADCLGATEAPDCDSRAAALEADLLEHLAELTDETDASTRALFEQTLRVGSPRAQAIALDYFAAQPTPPETIAERVRVFFFGPDAEVGFPAAQVFQASDDAADQALAQRYFDGRSDESHGGVLPVGEGFLDSWADGQALDLAFDSVDGFLPSELYEGAERLLMIDRVVPDYFVGEDARMLVTGFVTDASVADVSAHFTAVFGHEPYMSQDDANTRIEAISEEMSALEDALAAGDSDAMDRFMELSEEFTVAQRASTLGLRLSLASVDASAHVFWSDFDPDTAVEQPMKRSVAIGTDAALSRTVIRVFAGDAGLGGASEGEGEDTGEGEGELGGDEDDGAQGCGCEAAGAGGRPGAALVGVALATLVLGRRRTQHPRS